MSANEDGNYFKLLFSKVEAHWALTKRALTNKSIRKQGRRVWTGSLFDIVAGTSIGAINSSVLMGHYLKNNSWEGTDETLLEFWDGLMCSSIADSLLQKNSIIRFSWDYMKIFNQDLADTENARRFWSIFEFAFTPRGVPNMFKSVPHIGSNS